MALSYFYQALSSLYAVMQEEKVSDDERAVEPAIRYIETRFSESIPLRSFASCAIAANHGCLKLFALRPA